MTVIPVVLSAGKTRKLSDLAGETIETVDPYVVHGGVLGPLSRFVGLAYYDADLQVVVDGNRLQQIIPGEAPPPPVVALLTMVNEAGGVNCTLTDLGDDEWQVTKTGGSGNGWNASAYGSQALTGDFILRFLPAQTDAYFNIGVSLNPNDAQGYTKVDYSLGYNPGAFVSSLTGFGGLATSSYDTSTYWFVKRTGSTLSVGHGGTDGVTGYSEDATATEAGTLYADSMIYGDGAGFRIARLV